MSDRQMTAEEVVATYTHTAWERFLEKERTEKVQKEPADIVTAANMLAQAEKMLEQVVVLLSAQNNVSAQVKPASISVPVDITVQEEVASNLASKATARQDEVVIEATAVAADAAKPASADSLAELVAKAEEMKKPKNRPTPINRK